jgi:hypothetical protein
MLWNSDNSKVFLVVWAKARDAADNSTRVKSTSTKRKLIFLIGLTGVKKWDLRGFNKAKVQNPNKSRLYESPM